MSAVLNLLHITDFEGNMQGLLGSTTAGVVKPIEYIFTCPFMMLTLVVLAGDTVPVSRQMEVAALTTAVLILGFFASLMTQLSVKLMFFGAGVLMFTVLLFVVERNVRDHSAGTESLFKVGHGSPYKALCLKVVSTWVLFPIWWLFSAEGLNLVTQPEYNTIISAILNIMAKGVYVVFVERIHDRYLGEESLMSHPSKKPHQMQQALGRAARLGPAGAIQAAVKSIEMEEKQKEYICNLMTSIDAKNAAEYLVSETPYVARIKSDSTETPYMARIKSDASNLPTGGGNSNYPDYVSENHMVIKRLPESLHSSGFNGHEEMSGDESSSHPDSLSKDHVVIRCLPKAPQSPGFNGHKEAPHIICRGNSQENHQGDHHMGRSSFVAPLHEHSLQGGQQMERRNEGVGSILATECRGGGVSKARASDWNKIRREKSCERMEP
jgi:hypothetical protein